MDALDREFNEMCRGVAPAARVAELGKEAAALQLRPASQAHPADIVEAARRDQEFRFQMMKLQAQEAERRRGAGLPP